MPMWVIFLVWELEHIFIGGSFVRFGVQSSFGGAFGLRSVGRVSALRFKYDTPTHMFFLLGWWAALAVS